MLKLGPEFSFGGCSYKLSSKYYNERGSSDMRGSVFVHVLVFIMVLVLLRELCEKT